MNMRRLAETDPEEFGEDEVQLLKDQIKEGYLTVAGRYRHLFSDLPKDLNTLSESLWDGYENDVRKI
jgi:hypothetical protein